MFLIAMLRRKGTSASRAILFIFALMLCGVIVFPWPTLPGGGMLLTVNLLVWATAACGLLCLSRNLWRAILKCQNSILSLILGAILLTIPLGWTKSSDIPAALPRLAALWGMVIAAALLLQSPARKKDRKAVYGIIVIAGLIQVALACWQILSPGSAHHWLGYSFAKADGRPLGSLMQVNLLGSFLATSALSALWLSHDSRTLRGKSVAWLSTLILIAGVVITQSRTGEMGLSVGVVALCLTNRERRFSVTCAALGVAAILLGLATLSLRPAQLVDTTVAQTTPIPHTDNRPSGTNARLDWNHQHSALERITMVKGALAMIAAHPLTGYGLGSFESQFPRTLFVQGLGNPFTVSVEYPHNELLYVWSEGGIVALCGLILCLKTLLMPQLKNRQSRMRALIMLPILVHMMTEYPLYLSAIHGVLLVVLFWLAFPGSLRKPHRRHKNLNNASRAAVQLFVCALGVGTVVFMLTGVQSALQLMKAEKDLFAAGSLSVGGMNPWAQSDRRLFDTAVADLMQFNKTREVDLLRTFHQDADTWLSRHNDPNLIASMMQVDRFLSEPDVSYWWHRGCESFHLDPRFSCDSVFNHGDSQNGQ